MELNLKDKIVVLTGGTGGIGQFIALEFLKEEAIVILLYRNDEKLIAVKNWLATLDVDLDSRLFSIKTSITDVKEINTTIKSIVEQHGRIDVLVNGAGYAVETPFLMLEEDQIEGMIDLNFKSPLYLIKAVLRSMIRQKSGNIVNITSVSTHAFGRGITVYASAKAALERLTQTIAQEVGKKNIRLNAVCPGVIDTKMSTQLRSVAGSRILDNTAMNCYGDPIDIAKAVLFLASEETASFITGHVLNVDGGLNL